MDNGGTYKARIVVFEDEDLVRTMISEVLTTGGYDVHGAPDAQGGMAAVRREHTDLVVLDLNLPEKMKGLEICRELRSDPRTHKIPVLVVTGNNEESFEAALFDAGADDYIRKNSFRPDIFLRRVGAVLRRARRADGSAIQRGPLWLHPLRREALIEGNPLPLTPTEFDILMKLVTQPDRALSRQDLLDRGEAEDDDAIHRTVDVHILSIRRKLGDYAWLISTVFGVGYRVGSPPSDAEGESETG